MKTTIDSSKGVVTQNQGSGLTIEGRDYHEAPFDERWDDQYAFFLTGISYTYEAYRNTNLYMYFYKHNSDDDLTATYQMSHGWDPTTAIRPHFHVIPMTTGSGVVKFNYSYSWCIANQELSGSAGWTSGSVTASFVPSDQYKQKVVSFGSISPPADATESALFMFRVDRPGSSDADDTYNMNKDHGTAAANVALLFPDIHFQRIKAGSVNELYDVG